MPSYDRLLPWRWDSIHVPLEELPLQKKKKASDAILVLDQFPRSLERNPYTDRILVSWSDGSITLYNCLHLLPHNESFFIRHDLSGGFRVRNNSEEGLESMLILKYKLGDAVVSEIFLGTDKNRGRPSAVLFDRSGNVVASMGDGEVLSGNGLEQLDVLGIPMLSWTQREWE